MKRIGFILLALATFSSCNQHGLPNGDADNGGLILPDQFEAVVVADSTGRARHIAVNDNGDIYVKMRGSRPKGLLALRDTDNDGKADVKEYFGDYDDQGHYGTAMRIYNGYIYFSTAGEVYRQKLTPGELVPKSPVELVMKDDYKNDVHGAEHIAKPIAFDDSGHLYVQFGAPGDMCQGMGHERVPGTPGLQPCPQLEEHAGVWQFDANKLNQTQKDGRRYATGIRSIVGMDWNHKENALYALQHGRDDLHRSWPAYYNDWQSAVFPSEEFFKVTDGFDGGWPYYYYDQIQQKKLLNPEYGGDGKKEGDGAKLPQPLIGFPGHFAPNDLLFYTGDQFPERYKNGAFIAFHGSTIRAPYPQAGYFIAFVPFKDGKPSGEWEVFADGFAGTDTIVKTSDAKYRPMALAMGPDGSLYIGESEKGKIWRVMYKGDKTKFSDAQLAKMAERKKTATNIKTPDPVEDNLNKGIPADAQVYYNYCVNCHQIDGQGDGTRFPPLAGSEWVTGDKNRLIAVLLNGLSGPITINGKSFNYVMPPHNFLKDEDLSQVLTYIRKSFGNNAGPVTTEEVKKMRANLSK
jgi:glucose/arabinose dehydrogenase/mono/diheme cytochrome c family protein